MTTAGSCTVIDGSDSSWDGSMYKLYSTNKIHYLHFDGNSLKANGGDTDNGEKKNNMVLGRLLVKDIILYPSVCENIRVRIYKRG